MDIVIRKRKSKSESKGIATKKTHRRAAACVEVTSEHLYRRAYSEMTLLDLMGEFNWKEGQSYHFITGGDIDGLSYLKGILRQQPLEHCILSTWRMSGEDILDVQNFVESGKIKKLDLYIGEVFPSSYKIEMGMLRDLYANDGEKMGGGKTCCLPQSLKDLRGYRSEVRIRLRGLDEHQHQPSYRAVLCDHQQRPIRLLQGVLRWN